jgi:hypothetical protein
MARLPRLRRADPTTVPTIATGRRPTTATLAAAHAASSRPSPVAAAPALPPSVARVAERTRLSAELLAAMLDIEQRTKVSLDDIERADAIAERMIARRRQRASLSPASPHRARPDARAPAGPRTTDRRAS